MYKFSIAVVALCLLVACSDDDDNNNGNARQDTVAPVIEALADLSLDADTSSDAIAINAQDNSTDDQDLVVTAVADDENIIAGDGLLLSLTNGTRTLVITPQSDTIGETTVTISVSDAAGNLAMEDFKVTINPRELAAENLVDEIVQLDADADPVFINQVSITDEVDPDIGFDALVD